MVGPVIFDTIKRYLTYLGYEVTWVVNITDVDDKLIAQMHERGLPMPDIAEEMVVDYLSNLQGLGVDTIDHMPRATEHMGNIIKFVQALIDRGHAYMANGDVLFDVASDREYGKLSNRTADSQQGEGGEHASKKRSPGDFALWKSAKPGEPAWDSPWGQGRPGWHIECSAMSRALLGETFDIHGGGLDLVFPHHENELAQSECCHNKPMVRYWLHNGLLRAAADTGKVGGRGDREESKKVSRSEGAGGLADVIAQHGGERIRFLLLSTHYRSTVVYGDQGLEEASTALESFYRFFERYQRITRQRFYNLPPIARRADGEIAPGGDALLTAVAARRAAFLDKMDDDFNTGGAIAELFDLLRDLNKYADQHKLDEFESKSVEDRRNSKELATFTRAVKTLRELTAILGLFRTVPATRGGGGDSLTPKLMQFLIQLRADSRAKKDFATADSIRKGLTEIGVTLEDRAGGTEWTRS
jgi:cysteinyl-tRNA synthetase